MEDTKLDNQEQLLSQKTFDLLTELSDKAGTKKNPKIYYSKLCDSERYRADIMRYIKKPFYYILREARDRLPDIAIKQISNTLYSTEFLLEGFQKQNEQKYILNYKSFYWIIKEQQDLHIEISLNLNQDTLSINFSIYFCQVKQKKVCRKALDLLSFKIALNFLLSKLSEAQNLDFNKNEFDLFQEWLKDDNQHFFKISNNIVQQQVLQLSSEALIQLIINTYTKFFLLSLLMIYDDPTPKIEEYIKSLGLSISDSIMTNLIHINYKSEYTLTQLSQISKISEDELKRYIKAIERKKQVIFYGSPGTGKTFLAQELAKYLISRTYGESDLIQFHPAYCYEDFMQGIRPRVNENGTLTYEMVPGRFLEFCEEARNIDTG